MNAEQNKKSLKMTNVTQFQKLMCLMEQFPHLATGTPTFGGSRAAMEHTWETVAEKLNAHGPPERNGGEWKKVWQDQKCRLKKKIAGNNKSLHGTGGGPCVINNLTALELDVDRICHLSSAAAPSGQVFGVQKHQKKMMFSHSSNIVVLDNTPPRSSGNVAVVTPTRSGTVKQIENVSLSASHHEMSEVFTPNESPILPLQRSQGISFTSTPSGSQQSKKKVKNPFQRKRKIDDNSSEKHEQLKLLKKQLEVQETSVVAMNAQAEASRECAYALKAQLEVSKAILDTLKTQAAHNEAQAEISRASLEALKSQAESTGVIAQALVDIVKHLKDEDL